MFMALFRFATHYMYSLCRPRAHRWWGTLSWKSCGTRRRSVPRQARCWRSFGVLPSGSFWWHKHKLWTWTYQSCTNWTCRQLLLWCTKANQQLKQNTKIIGLIWRHFREIYWASSEFGISKTRGRGEVSSLEFGKIFIRNFKENEIGPR